MYLDKQIEALKDQIHRAQMTDNRYATSGRMSEDQCRLTELERRRAVIKFGLELSRVLLKHDATIDGVTGLKVGDALVEFYSVLDANAASKLGVDL